MPVFVHIAPDKAASVIRRSGIAPSRYAPEVVGAAERVRRSVVWAFPVLPSHTLTYSWSRELKRRGTNTVCAVVFRIPDDEPVLARHFVQESAPMTAAEAAGMIRALPDPRGYEVMILRRVLPSEIMRIEALRRPMGWRVFPQSKATPPPLCDCPVCAPPGYVKAARYKAGMVARLRKQGMDPLPTRRELRAQWKRQQAEEEAAAAQTKGAAATQ